MSGLFGQAGYPCVNKDVGDLPRGQRVKITYMSRGVSFDGVLVPLLGYGNIITAEAAAIVALMQGHIVAADALYVILCRDDGQKVAILRSSIKLVTAI